MNPVTHPKEHPMSEQDATDQPSSSEQVISDPTLALPAVEETQVVPPMEDSTLAVSPPPPPPMTEPVLSDPPVGLPTEPAAPAFPQPQAAFPPPQATIPQAPSYPPPPAGFPQAGGYTPTAGEAMTPEQERNIGVLTHAVSGIAFVLSVGTLGFVAALVLYIVYKDRGPFVRSHTANALNVQITCAIMFVAGVIFTVTLIGAIIGIPLMIAAGIYGVVMHILGALKASNGEFWNPPLTIQFVR